MKHLVMSAMLILASSSAFAAKMECIGGGSYTKYPTRVQLKFALDDYASPESTSIDISRATGPRTPGINVKDRTVNVTSIESPFRLSDTRGTFSLVETKSIGRNADGRSFMGKLTFKTIGSTTAVTGLICRIYTR